MLDRKEALLNALKELNQQAEHLAAGSPLRHPSLYPPVFRQNYTWVLNNLTRTKSVLNPALEKLRELVSAEPGGQASRTSPAVGFVEEEEGEGHDGYF
jgi:hypothetical protein